MKKLLVILMVLVFSLSLISCGKTKEDKTDKKTDNQKEEVVEKKDKEDTKEADKKEVTDTDKEAEADRPYYVRDPKEVTGVITLYTTFTETEQQIIREIWTKYYPDCKMEFQTDSVGTLTAKIRSDSSSDADVLLGGQFAADGDTYYDILQPYTAACDKEQLYHDPNGYITFYDVQLVCIVVNPDLRDELGVKIEGYADLLNPDLKGKIILAAPDASSSGWRQLQTMLATMGDKFDDDKAWDYIGKMMPSAFSTTSSKDVYNLVISGEYVAGLSYESGVVGQIKDGAPVECVYMKEGNTAMAGGVAITKNAPNLVAAQAMCDLISSAEFQNTRAEIASGRPSNGKADLHGLPDQKSMEIKDLDFAYLESNKDRLMTKWNDLYAEVN